MSNKNAIEGWCGLPYPNGLLGRESLLLDGVKEAVHSRSRLPLLAQLLALHGCIVTEGCRRQH